ncbi:tRNA dimethylallyltransferase [Planococcus citri]|uniref:tRNA dimethylallyltransferase n=1 Tax=Planococcus citri TaxID=170843 RepID=UPI0031F8D564
MSRVPIVCVLGATGTGKSKLAIELAKKFNGEVISADSMQVYKGLDIASNKVTQAEMEGIPHHMLDILRPMDRYSVTDFRNQALPIIDNILKRKKLPIVVGGTNYYIEAVLYEMLVEPVEENSVLIANRCLVLKDFSQINQWKTYKGSVLPTLKKNETEKNDTDVVEESETETSCDIKKIVTKDDINLLIGQVKSIQCDFRNSIESILETMNLTYQYYSRTFYRIGSGERDSVNDEDLTGIRQPADTDIVDILHLETRIMEEYISSNLKHMVNYLNDKYDFIECDIDENATSAPKYEMDLEECYSVLSQSQELPFAKNFSFVDGSRFWNLPMVCRLWSDSSCAVIGADYGQLSDEFRDVYERRPHLTTNCYFIFKKFVECVIALTTVRIKRLNLIRVVDEETLLDFSNHDLYAELKLVDPEMLIKIHPNNRRKVIRTLQAYFSTGETLGQFQKKQHQLDGACEVSAPLRYPDACLLWICCDQEVLTCRLTVRVNEMMERGLIDELLEFHKQYNTQRLAYNLDADYSRGVFQTIGLKEFHDYLVATDEERNSNRGEKLLDKGVELLKIATIKYSKYQSRYITNKFIKVPDEKKVPPIFRLDGTDLDKWHDEVEAKAFNIVENYLNGNDIRSMNHTPIPCEAADPRRFEDGTYHCETCDRMFVGAYQWQAHVRSKKHRAVLYSKKVQELKKKFAALKMPKKEDSTGNVEQVNEARQ